MTKISVSKLAIIILENTRILDIDGIPYTKKLYPPCKYPSGVAARDMTDIYDKFIVNVVRHSISSKNGCVDIDKKIVDLYQHWPYLPIYDRYRSILTRGSQAIYERNTSSIVHHLWNMTVLSKIPFGSICHMWETIGIGYSDVWSVMVTRCLAFTSQLDVGASVTTSLSYRSVVGTPHILSNRIIEVGSIQNKEILVVKLLIYAAILRRNGRSISGVTILDPITGIYDIDISGIDMENILRIVDSYVI